jgi:protein O-GlcNAc transferase
MKTSRKKSRSGAARRVPMDPECLALMRLVDAASYAQAETAARRILGGRPTHALALKALGFALIGQGRYDEALPIVSYSLERNAHDPELHNNLGIVLSSLMRWNESINCFARSIEIKADDPEVLKNYGVALSRMHRFDEAVPFFLKAIECHSGDYLEAIEQLSGALLSSNRNDEAWTCLNELRKNDPGNANILSPFLCASLKRCDWTDLDARLRSLRSLSADYRSLTDNPFVTLSFPEVNAAEQFQVAENFARRSIPPGILDAPDVEWPLGEPGQVPERRLRIGYLSADFRNHPVGLILPQVIELHDRSQVEVFAYSLGADDQSDIRKRLMAAFDHFVDLLDCSVAETAQRIRADRIDILVDLNGWTTDGRPEALALRCAPVQVNWLGYAGTLGTENWPTIFSATRSLRPFEDQACYAETLVHLPNCYLPADSSTA